MERRYKDSGIEWIGNLPETWEISSIKHLMQLYAGATPKSDNNELWDGDIHALVGFFVFLLHGLNGGDGFVQSRERLLTDDVHRAALVGNDEVEHLLLVLFFC